jgi:hypothetical protein
MNASTKTLVIFGIWVACFALLWVGISSNGGKNVVPTNCWDSYQTEDEAIKHCERH